MQMLSRIQMKMYCFECPQGIIVESKDVFRKLIYPQFVHPNKVSGDYGGKPNYRLIPTSFSEFMGVHFGKCNGKCQ